MERCTFLQLIDPGSVNSDPLFGSLAPDQWQGLLRILIERGIDNRFHQTSTRHFATAESGTPDLRIPPPGRIDSRRAGKTKRSKSAAEKSLFYGDGS